MRHKQNAALAAAVLLLLLQGGPCAAEAVSEAVTEAVGEAAAEAVIEPQSESPFPMDPSVMSPWRNTNVIGMVTEDVTADVKDDFYLAVNHDWMITAKLRPGYTSESPLHKTLDLVKDRCIDLLNDPSLTGSDAEIIQSYYELWMDWDARNEAGLTPFMPAIDKLLAVDTLEEMTDYLLSDENFCWGNPLCDISLQKNAEDSSLYEVQIAPTPLSLEDADEYGELSPYGEGLQQANNEMVRYMLSRIGREDEADEIIRDSAAFETKAAGVMYSEEEKDDPALQKELIHPVTMEELAQMSPDYPLCAYMEKTGWAASPLINLAEPAWLEGLNALYTEENLPLIRAYVLTTTLREVMQYADEDAFRALQAIERERDGTDESKSDEQLAYEDCRGMFPNQFARVYVRRYFTDEDRKKIEAICEDVRDTYREMLSGTDWLTEGTRKKAIEKLDKMEFRALYPDKWENDEMIRVTPKEDGGSYAQAQMEFVRTCHAYDLSFLGKTVDKEIWALDLLQSNAEYFAASNTVYIYAGYLGEDIWHEDMTIEEQYGGLGHTIAHEISHAFDPGGALYDADGNMADWWTEDDYDAFNARTARLIDWFDHVTAFDDGTRISGVQVQTEAVADMAGMKCLLEMAGKIDGFDYDTFFRANAAFWRRLDTLPKAQMIAQTDSHPLHYLRTNAVLQQFDRFLETYDIQPGDGMYLAPEDRIAVW